MKSFKKVKSIVDNMEFEGVEKKIRNLETQGTFLVNLANKIKGTLESSPIQSLVRLSDSPHVARSRTPRYN